MIGVRYSKYPLFLLQENFLDFQLICRPWIDAGVKSSHKYDILIHLVHRWKNNWLSAYRIWQPNKGMRAVLFLVLLAVLEPASVATRKITWTRGPKSMKKNKKHKVTHSRNETGSSYAPSCFVILIWLALVINFCTSGLTVFFVPVSFPSFYDDLWRPSSYCSHSKKDHQMMDFYSFIRLAWKSITK